MRKLTKKKVEEIGKLIEEIVEQILRIEELDGKIEKNIEEYFKKIDKRYIAG